MKEREQCARQTQEANLVTYDTFSSTYLQTASKNVELELST